MWFVVGSVNTVILLLFWWAVIKADGNAQFSIPAMTTYYILLFTLATSTICHIEYDIANEDIYKGNLYSYLLKPYSYLLRKFFTEIVWRFTSGFWAILVLTILSSIGLSLSIPNDPSIWLLTAVSAVLGMLVSFYFKTILGLSSIWLTNIGAIMDLFEILSIILGGFVLPIQLMPSPLKEISWFSPFAMSVFYPVHILTTQLSMAEILWMMCTQLFWLVIMFFLAKLTLKLGIKHYAGVSQ